MKRFLLFLCLLAPASADPNWLPPEVMGIRKLSRQEILEALPPLPKGPYQLSQMEPFKGQGAQLRKRFHLPYAHLSVLGVDSQHVRLYVEIVEEGDESRLATTPDPTGHVEIPSLLVAPESRWRELTLQRRVQFTMPELGTDSGHLDTLADPELHGLALDLASRAPAQRALLLEALQEDARAPQRRIAASLLEWAGAPEEVLPIMQAHLTDSSQEVRWEAGTYCCYYLRSLSGHPQRMAMAHALLTLLMRPDFTDRDHALRALQAFAIYFPEERQELYPLAREPLELLEQQTVEIKVRERAKKLLELLGGPSKGVS